MRVMFICAAGIVAGKERQTLDLMMFLKQRGHDVFCITSSWGDGEYSRLLTTANIPHKRMRLGYIALNFRPAHIKMTLHQLVYTPSLWWKYRRLLRKVNPDVIVHSNIHHLLMLWPILGSAKQVFHVHDVFPVSSSYSRLFRLFNSKVGLFAGVSKFVCNQLPKLGIPSPKIKLVYNGVRPPEVQSRTLNEVPVIAIVGQVAEWKGHEVLMEALKPQLDLSWKLYIIGAGEEAYISKLEKVIADAGMSERVTFMGKRIGLENIYRDVDISCVPSLYRESFGLVAAEPGFFEIPVVASDLGGLPEIVINNQTGIIVPSGNATALSSAIRELLLDPDRRRKYGKAAREYVNKYFSIEASVSQMESVLKEVTNV